MVDANQILNSVLDKAGSLQVRQLHETDSRQQVGVHRQCQQMRHVVERSEVFDAVFRNVNVSHVNVGVKKLDVCQLSTEAISLRNAFMGWLQRVLLAIFPYQGGWQQSLGFYQ